MKFDINELEYEIIEKTQDEIKQIIKEKNEKHMENPVEENGRYFGVTYVDDLKIYLDKDLSINRKKKTLVHELTHCYINSYITHEDKNYDEEMVCDIVANSNDIINKIVRAYFTNVKCDEIRKANLDEIYEVLNNDNKNELIDIVNELKENK